MKEGKGSYNYCKNYILTYGMSMNYITPKRGREGYDLKNIYFSEVIIIGSVGPLAGVWDLF